jgi:hypothetical protein
MRHTRWVRKMILRHMVGVSAHSLFSTQTIRCHRLRHLGKVGRYRDRSVLLPAAVTKKWALWVWALTHMWASAYILTQKVGKCPLFHQKTRQKCRHLPPKCRHMPTPKKCPLQVPTFLICTDRTLFSRRRHMTKPLLSTPKAPPTRQKSTALPM